MRQPVPLSSLHSGAKARIASVNAGRGLHARLSAMGLLPGAEIQLVKGAMRGPVVVKVKESKLVLGRGIADKILVQ